jgi:hypothetical protein
MRGERVLAVAVGILCASTAWAERAQQRGGGGFGARGGSGARGGGHSAAVARHPSSQAGARGVAVPRTQAQLRHPRAGTGTGYFRHGYPYHPYYPYYPYYGYGYGGYPYYGYWGWPAYWGLSVGFGYGYGYGAGYGYGPGYGYGYGGDAYSAGYAAASRSASLRVLVDPVETRVYVDGYYAGIVDDFDGIFQRLNVSPGRHEISLKLEGHRTHHVRLYVGEDQTVKIEHRMAPGTGEDRVEASGQPVDEARYEDRPRPGEAAGEEVRSYGEPGTLNLDVRPGDATVYLDGEFRGEARALRGLRLPPGRHRVEIVRPGYRTEEREVEVRPGDTADLAVDLERR